MKLIAGLGNPGRSYQGTRHNLGFEVLDALASRLGLVWSEGHAALVARSGQGGDGLLLLEPQTFMNASGQAVAWAARRSGVAPEEILIVHDDIDLPLGTLRLREGGRSGGQRGVEDILIRLGSQRPARLKLGVSRPPPGQLAADWVLSRFRPEERPLVERGVALAAQAALLWSEQGLAAAQSRFGGRYWPPPDLPSDTVSR